MSDHLPALLNKGKTEPARAGARSREGGLAMRWLRSPLAGAVADIAPDLLRFAGRAMQPRSGVHQMQAHLPPSGANGLTVSEVEIDVASPFIRRVVVRTTNAWSVAPEVALAKARTSRNGRLSLGAISLAGLAVLGFAAARRVPLSLPSRLRGE